MVVLPVRLTGRPLLFDTAVPLCSREHRDWKLDRQRTFHHCKSVAFLPLTAAEFPLAALEFPIVLIEDGEHLVPVALLGSVRGINPKVSESGAWLGWYVPAYARQYPFILAPREDGNGYVVCIDSNYRGLSDDHGDPLFEGNQQTELTQDAIKFASEYQLQREATDEFTRALRSSDLLQPSSAVLSFKGREHRKLDGFLALKREWFARLSASDAAQWVNNGYLEKICLLQASLVNFDRLV